MLKKQFLVSSLALAFAVGIAQAQTPQSALIANLHDDFDAVLSDADAAPSSGDTFSSNGWSFWQGGAELEYDADLANAAAWQTVAGYKAVAGGNASDTTLELGHVAADGVFDNQAAAADELGFHPSFAGGANADTIIRWTADRAYVSLDFEYSYRRAAAGSTGVAIRFVENGVAQSFNYNNPNVSATAVTGTLTFNDLQQGDAVEVVLFGGAGNRSGGDQSFGNFIVRGVPKLSKGTVVLISGVSGWMAIMAAWVLLQNTNWCRRNK